MSTVRVWHITESNIFPVHLLDLTSLDAVTRQLPDGYYSTFRTYDECRRVLGLTSHLQRLFDPVSPPDVDAGMLRRKLRRLLEGYCPGEARVRAVMTQQGQVYLALEPLQLLPQEVYEKGVRVETTELQREHPRLKSTGFIGRSDSERKHIAQEGIFEALLTKEGVILEGMTSNFFYVQQTRAPKEHRDDSERKERHESSTRAVEAGASSTPAAKRTPRSTQLCTARDDILLGVTRQTVIEIARGRGLDVTYKPLKRDQLTAVVEAFITSSSRGVVPVIQVDTLKVGEGRPGPITGELMTAYEEYVLENAELI